MFESRSTSGTAPLGITIEFYSADPQEMVELFSSADEQAFFETLKSYPVADLSLHLLLPDDLDRLCRCLKKRQALLPETFRDLFIEQLWYDGISESLTLLSERFAIAWTRLDEREVEGVAQEWVETFGYQEPSQKVPAYQALVQLREVALDVIAHQKSLILRLIG